MKPCCTADRPASGADVLANIFEISTSWGHERNHEGQASSGGAGTLRPEDGFCFVTGGNRRSAARFQEKPRAVRRGQKRELSNWCETGQCAHRQDWRENGPATRRKVLVASTGVIGSYVIADLPCPASRSPNRRQR